MNNSEYWKKRFEALENSAVSKGANYYASLEKEYIQANRRIENEISAWYTRFAKNNEITLADARKLLNSSELKEFKWNVKDYIKYGEENALNGMWIKELENASAKVHISRLEALKLQLQQQMEVLYGNQTDGIDTLARKIYSDGYYHTAFEIQKGFNLGWDLQGISETQLKRVLDKPWTADGLTFKDKCWKQKADLVSTVSTELTQAIMRGDSPDKAIKAISSKFGVAKSKAGRLVMTESAYFASAAQKDCFNELGVEQYEIVATLDSHTSHICQELDGTVMDMKNYEPGVTAPPFHPWCRTTTVPYFEDNYTERAARNADGNTYYVPGDMKYSEWKKQYVNSPIKVDQAAQITKKDVINAFSVNRDLVNSKQYHDKFEGLTNHKSVNESIYQESMKMLEHRDSTDYEDIVALDARTGDVIVENTLSVQKGKTGFTEEQYKALIKHEGKVILLHNHPNGSRPSYTDIYSLFENSSFVDGSVAVGHDGSVHLISNPSTKIDKKTLDKLWDDVYNSIVEIYPDEDLASHYALDIIYQKKIFDYERR